MIDLTNISTDDLYDLMPAIQKEIDNRKKVVKDFVITPGECYFDKLSATLYHIVDVKCGMSSDIIVYSEIEINENQIYGCDDIESLKSEMSFNEMVKIDDNIFQTISKKCDEYNDTVNKMHTDLYNECKDLLKTIE